MISRALGDQLLPFPVDPAIPALKTFSGRGLQPTLEDAGVSCRTASAELVAHRPGVRAVFRLALDGVPASLKTYSQDHERLALLLRRFEARGLASARPPTVTPLLGYHTALRFIVTGWLQGPSADELIKRGQPERAGSLAAQWLRLAEPLAIPGGDLLGPEQLIEKSGLWISDLDQADPELAGDASGCVRELARRLPPPRAIGLRHANFIPRHVIDMGGGPGVIDWDAFRQGPPEIDAAYFLASLSRLQTVTRLGALTRRAAEVFQPAVASLVDEGALRWYRAAFILEHAASLVQRRKDGWPVRAAAMLAEARDLAESE